MIRLKKSNIVKEVATELSARKLEEMGYERINTVEEKKGDSSVEPTKEGEDEPHADQPKKDKKQPEKEKQGGKKNDAGSGATDNTGSAEQSDSNGDNGQP